MLQTVEVTKNCKDLYIVKELYENSFPENERINFDFMLTDLSSDNRAFEITAIYDGELFVGFVVTLNSGDISHILYFAVDEELRSNGYGSEILRALHKSKPGQRFIADVEKPDAKSGNNAQREKRIRFYSRNGYKMTDVEYRWNEENYLIMSCNGDISKEEHKAFWEQRADMLQRAADEGSSSEHT